jgi:hypothetical protein
MIAVGIPVLISGVGGTPHHYVPGGTPIPPKGTIFVLPGFGHLEPAFFIGIGLLIAGVYLLGQSIKTFGVRTSVRSTVPPEVHR